VHNDELTLAILRHAESMRTQKSLAQELGYSVGKINYVLKALIAKGLIKAERFAASDNKKQYRYLLTRKGIEEKVALTEKFIERKKQEFEELRMELELMKSKI
jgi:EPS-associated MarR family transcriptional regulator